MLTRRAAACLLALALFAVACEKAPDPDAPEDHNTGVHNNPDIDNTPTGLGQPAVVEGSPGSPPEGWPPNRPYVTGNTQNPDGTWSPQYSFTPPESPGESLQWQPGVAPQSSQTAIVNGRLHVLHPFDSDGDGLYDTMSHYQPPAGSPSQVTPVIPDIGNPGYTPPAYVPPVQTSYVPPPAPSTPALGTPSWHSPSCAVFDGKTQLFYKWTDVTGAEWYEMDGNYQLQGSSDTTGWNWIGFDSHTTITVAGEADLVRAKVRAAASGGQLGAWSPQRLLICEELATPTADLDCIDLAGGSQTLIASWRDADGVSVVSSPVQWRIDGPDGTREGTAAAGSFNVLVTLAAEPDGYWRDYTLKVWATANGIAVLDPAVAQARCAGTEPPLPSNLSVSCTAAPGSTAPLVEVSWDAPTGIAATSYEAEGDLAYTGVSASFSRTGAYGRSYEVRVRATDGTTTTGWTALETGDCPPAVPVNLDVSCTSGGTLLTVSWDSDPLAASFEAVEDGGDLAAYSGADNSFTRASTVGDSYTWQVRAIGSSGKHSEWSSWMSGSCSLVPPTPANVAMSCVGPPSGTQTLTVTWDPPPGSPAYDIWYNIGDPANFDTDPANDQPSPLSNHGQTAANRTRSTTVTVTLPAPANQEGRLYTAQVQAESTAGTSGWSQTSGVHDPLSWVRCPGKPPALDEITIEAHCRYRATPEHVEASWVEIADRASGDTYTYAVRSDPSTAWVGAWVLDPGGGKATREVSEWGIPSGNGIQVRATNSHGNGPWTPTAGLDENCRLIGK